MYNLFQYSHQSSVNHFGTDVIAAWAANGKIDAIFWMVMGAFGVSVTTFVGQNFGAQQYARIRKSVRACMVMAFLAAAGMSALMLLAGKPILSIFSDDPAVIAQGEAVIRTLAPLYFTYVCVEILSGAVRGTGDSLLPTLITCLGICVLANCLGLRRAAGLEHHGNHCAQLSDFLGRYFASVYFLLPARRLASPQNCAQRICAGRAGSA